MKVFKQLTWFFKQEKRRYLIGIGFLSLTSLANLIPPRILGIMADQLDQGQISWSKFLICILGIVLAASILFILRYFWRKEIWGGAAVLERQLRAKLFNHFMKMDRTFYQKHGIGDLMAHATNDIFAIQNVAGDGILTLVDSLMMVVTTMLAMMVLVDWRLTLLALLPMPFLALSAERIGHRLHFAFDKSQAAFSTLNDKTQESISGIKVLKAFGQADEDIATFNDLVDKTIKINRRSFIWDSLFDPVGTLFIGLTYTITIIYGGQLVMHRTLTIGQLVTFIAYISNMIWPMFAIGYLFNILKRGSASYDRVAKILAEKSLISDEQADFDLKARDLDGDLKFAIKSFAYPDEKDQAVLKKINFNLQPGQTLGLVGKVGAGKTTLIQLLLREFDDYDGQITLNGHDIRQIPLNLLLRNIAYVPQNNFLFSTSIQKNIAFGEENASTSQVVQASQKSDLHQDILAMPKAYHTLVGENGLSLSGGQRQRLSIARALLKQSQILILDDALSAVDAKTETNILNSLKRERQDKTTIIATHRLSAVQNADLILVLKNGQIIERGRHQDLLTEHGWYHDMWQRQELAKKVGEANE